MFLPTVTAQVTSRQVRTYTRLRDGFHGSATVLRLGSGYAGLTTLPSGAVVYATTGIGAGEGHLEVHNLTMPGIAGLTGSRTYRFAEGTATVTAQDARPTATTPRVDELTFGRTEVRHLRMLGVRPDPTYGYSLYAFEARDGRAAPTSPRVDGHRLLLRLGQGAGTGRGRERHDPMGGLTWRPAPRGQLARRRPRRRATPAGRSPCVGRLLPDAPTRCRDRPTGSSGRISSPGPYPMSPAGAAGSTSTAAPASSCAVQSSNSPSTTTPSSCPTDRPPPSWSRDSRTPQPTPCGSLPKAPYPSPRTTPSVWLSQRTTSACSTCPTGSTTRVDLPQDRSRVVLFEGRQTVTAQGSSYEAELDAGTAVLLPPRLTLRPLSGGSLPVGLVAEVVDGATLRLTGPSCRIQVAGQGDNEVAVVRAGRTTTVSLRRADAYPLNDLALGRTVFPTNPLPPGMSDPSAAVDGDTETAWVPGSDGRMVVDLGAQLPIRSIRTEWTGGRLPALTAELSSDGLSYTPAGRLTGHGRTRQLTTDATARYVALATDASGKNDARLISLSVI